jgi:hypothetical protein
MVKRQDELREEIEGKKRLIETLLIVVTLIVSLNLNTTGGLTVINTTFVLVFVILALFYYVFLDSGFRKKRPTVAVIIGLVKQIWTELKTDTRAAVLRLFIGVFFAGIFAASLGVSFAQSTDNLLIAIVGVLVAAAYYVITALIIYKALDLTLLR